MHQQVGPRACHHHGSATWHASCDACCAFHHHRLGLGIYRTGTAAATVADVVAAAPVPVLAVAATDTPERESLAPVRALFTTAA